jgi:hypothetical protein
MAAARLPEAPQGIVPLERHLTPIVTSRPDDRKPTGDARRGYGAVCRAGGTGRRLHALPGRRRCDVSDRRGRRPGASGATRHPGQGAAPCRRGGPRPRRSGRPPGGNTMDEALGGSGRSPNVRTGPTGSQKRCRRSVFLSYSFFKLVGIVEAAFFCGQVPKPHSDQRLTLSRSLLRRPVFAHCLPYNNFRQGSRPVDMCPVVPKPSTAL